mgnify:CR=1 FL=1
MYCGAACLRACGNCVNFTGCVQRPKAEIKETETEKNVTEELPESEAEQEYLSDVQGLLAGTIVEKEKLDPNRWSDYFMIEEISEEISGRLTVRPMWKISILGSKSFAI